MIGTGAGGASAAYHLANFAASEGIPVNISIFERNDFVGGRCHTVNAYDDPTLPVELGASIFVQVNKILNDAVKEFNLSTDSLRPAAKIPGAALSVWNGEKFVFVQEGNYGWWDSAKLFWKYGLTPIKTVRLMRTVVGKFLEIYDEPIFPFDSLTQVAQDVGLLAVTAATGEQYLTENLITGPFVNEIVQASTRVNYASNLKYIHGLETMVCMAAENAHAVEGGNWQIFDGMIKAANATVFFENAITTVEAPKTKASITISSSSVHTEEHLQTNDFDEVILTGPLQFSNIGFKNLEVDVDEIPYVQLHVTLLASPHLMSPEFFNLPPDQPAPKVILTTLPKGEQPGRGTDGVGSPGFFSISLLRPITNTKTSKQEYLYKIFSHTAPNTAFLSSLFGFEEPDEDNDKAFKSDDISWIHRKLWNSYPYEYPRVTFEKIQLAEGLWYTGGMDSFISAMEANALMGRNVAGLIAKKWVGEKLGGMEAPNLLRKADAEYVVATEL